MQNRIDTRFAALKSAKKKGFVAYLAAGDPDLERTVDLVLALDAAGADVVELGIPFSDPLADGIVNQLAAQRALESGTKVSGIFEAIRKIRTKSEVPLVLFTYLNPVYVHGFERFHLEAASSGADGILILDLPPDEAATNIELTQPGVLSQIRLVAPTTPPERIPMVVKGGSGFVYYISREGVTGEQTSIAEGISDSVNELKRHTDLPIAVGFGISNPEQAATVAKSSDAVIVGSAIVKRIGEYGKSADAASKLESFVRPLVEAVKAV